MINKCEIGVSKTDIGEHSEYVYKYYLTQKPFSITFGNEIVSMDSYGIEIVREEVSDGRIVSMYEEIVECVSPCKDKVVNLIEYLRKNEVSPIHLVDAICDDVDNWVEDYDLNAKSCIL